VTSKEISSELTNAYKLLKIFGRPLLPFLPYLGGLPVADLEELESGRDNMIGCMKWERGFGPITLLVELRAQGRHAGFREADQEEVAEALRQC
jgi:hypothetical protein